MGVRLIGHKSWNGHFLVFLKLKDSTSEDPTISILFKVEN